MIFWGEGLGGQKRPKTFDIQVLALRLPYGLGLRMGGQYKVDMVQTGDPSGTNATLPFNIF